MCCIAACYLDRLTDELIDDMTATNQDGFGMAWIEKGKVRWQKGLDDITAKLFARHLPLPYVAHARLATVGGNGNGLAHPFPIEKGSSIKLKGSANRVLFHNGHVSDWRAIVHASDGRRGPILGNKWSDSRALAHVVATRGKGLLRKLADNRFAILNKDGIERFGKGWSQPDGEPTIWLSSDIGRAKIIQAYYSGQRFALETVKSIPAGVYAGPNWQWD
jgi:hypothetical protein